MAQQLAIQDPIFLWSYYGKLGFVRLQSLRRLNAIPAKACCKQTVVKPYRLLSVVRVMSFLLYGVVTASKLQEAQQ